MEIEQVFGRDIDDLLAYKTKKVVVIRDRILGGLYIISVVGVVCGYFIIDQMIMKQSYMAREVTISSVETSLRAPTQLQNISSLPYCEGGPGGASKILPCATGPDAWVQAPSSGGAELFVATRLKDIRDGAEFRTFVQDPERYTVGISLSLYAEQLYYHTADSKYIRRHSDLKTRLNDLKGKEIANALKRIDRFDVVELGVLAKAAGLSDFNSVRYDGTILLVVLHCPMTRGGTIDECEYAVRHLIGTEAEKAIVRGIDAKNGDKEVQERRGIKLVVSAAGEMGRFQWSSFMVAWVTSLGMLGMVVALVDFIMLKLMPLKEIYNQLKFQKSEDFGDYRDGDQAVVAKMSALQKEEPASTQLSTSRPPVKIQAGYPSTSGEVATEENPAQSESETIGRKSLEEGMKLPALPSPAQNYSKMVDSE